MPAVEIQVLSPRLLVCHAHSANSLVVTCRPSGWGDSRLRDRIVVQRPIPFVDWHPPRATTFRLRRCRRGCVFADPNDAVFDVHPIGDIEQDNTKKETHFD